MIGKENGLVKIEDTQALIEEYEEYLTKKLESVGAIIVDYPKVDHEEIAKKAMKRVKPFKQSGSGYRDCLIWETIKEILQENNDNEVVFITNNTADFWSGDGLSEELEEELHTNGIDPSKITLFKNVQDTIGELLLVFLNETDELKRKINNGSVEGVTLEDWVEDNVYKLLDVDNAGMALADVHSDECKIYISEVYESKNIKAVDVRKIDINRTYILMTADMGLGISVCADHYQFMESVTVESIFEDAGVFPAPYECVDINGNISVQLSVMVQDDNFLNANVELLELAGPHKAINCEFQT